MKFSPNSIRTHVPPQPLQRRSLACLASAALTAIAICAISLVAWQARAALPRWMQDAIGSGAIEAALYRMMEIPGVTALYPRPPKEAQEQLSGLIAKAPDQAGLYSLRAIEEEQALNFSAAEADWKTYAARAKDPTGAKLELANYYHRRLQAADEVQTLMEVGSAPAAPSEQYTAPADQRSWKAFERLLLLAADQALDDETFERTYAAWIARYPQQPSLYAREFRWLLDAGANRTPDRTKQAGNFDRASELIGQYRKAFPQDSVFPLKATALLEYKRGSIDKALATYDAGFQPLWPAELVQSYYALLADTHQQRRFLADARAQLAQNPDDLNAMARLFYASQQQGNLQAAQDIVEAYRLSKERRNASWSAQELYTVASLTEAIHAYPEAARYDFALYHAQGSISSGAQPQAEGLSGIIRILLTAPDEPVELGAGNLTMYRDIATLDQGPGYWNGILSLWLNSESPQQSYHEEELRAQPYFHRAKAAELLAILDKNYPNSPQRAELHKLLIHVLAEYGEGGLVVRAGNYFLTNFSATADESIRVDVAMCMADAYAQQHDDKDEFALYDRMLTELGANTAGMPLTAAAATDEQAAPTQTEEIARDGETSTGTGNDTSNGAASASTRNGEQSRPFEVTPGAPTGIYVAGSQEYRQLLERYLGRLTAAGQLPQALAVLRRELDRNPNDPLLYERLANFLQQNNLSVQQEEIYNEAIQKFQDKGWYDKLARLYLREKKREAFADLTKQVTNIFHGTDLEDYFGTVSEGGPQLFLQLNLYAHQRFPHDEAFVQNLLSAYHAKTTYDSAAWEKLLREHWSDTEQLRQQFFDYLSRNGKLDAELAQLHTLVPDSSAQSSNPDATRELAEAEMWRSHFEQSAPLLGSLAEAYPADEEIGTEASSVYRSLSYFDATKTERAIAIEKHLLAADPADTERLAKIGDIYSDSGADSTTGHENIAAAARYWRRISAVHPGTSGGYLQAATIFWDYFQFDDALGEIHEARAKFDQPALYGYEAGAIDEGNRDLSDAIQEYTQAAISIDSSGDSPAASRLLQLARRKASATLVDDESAKAVASSPSIPALQLRERVLEAQNRSVEIAPLLEGALAKATTFDQAQAIGSEAQSHSCVKLYELALQREVALAIDPVQKIELSYDLVRSYEGRKDLDDATHLVDQVYRDNSKLLGVVRATTDFYWRNKQSVRAIDTLLDAAKAAQPVQPALGRQFIVEAAGKANDSGSYAQARALIAPLIDPAKAAASEDDAYNAQYLAVVADSYARAGDDAGLKQFYLDELTAIHSPAGTMTAEERKQRTVLLRRGLIPALTRTKDFAGAVDQYIAILSAYPEDSNTAQEASLYALRYGRQQQLVDFASGTVKASPRDSRFAILLAQIDTTFEDYPAAIDAYAHAIDIRADRADLYASKADLEERLQRLDDACKDYERLYILSYENPDWMVKAAAVRARQGRKEDTVQALQRAWIQGHAATAHDYFRVATQLETWNMLDESLRFAELGVKAEGKDLLAGSEPGDRNGDDPDGAAIYVRLLTRKRQVQKALATLDAAREDAYQSRYSPGVLAAQVEQQGIAAVTNEEWRKRFIERRKQTADQRFQSAVLEIGKTAGAYFTPEEKQQFANLVDTRAAQHPEGFLWIDVAHAAGVTEEEARLRKQVLLDSSYLANGGTNPQSDPYLRLQRSRMEYNELARTMEAYAQLLSPENRTTPLTDASEAYRSAGDEAAELRVLREIGFERNNDAALRERYLQLLLKYDAPGFESFGASSADEGITFAAPNYAVAHSDLKLTRTSLTARSGIVDRRWENAYAALLGLYFRDLSPVTDSAFHSILGDDQTIGQRIASLSHSSEDADAEESTSPQLAGGIWFYYGMRYGVYRTLAPEKEWAKRDPEDFLSAGLERNPTAPNYVGLARAYADAGKTNASLVEYHHALELAPDSPAIHDAMALLLWNDGKKSDAIAEWREALAALDRVQNKGAAPESFWSGFALIAQHVGSRKLAAQLHSEMDAVLRGYLARNGNYRSNELLRDAFEASASPSEGTDWLLSLSTAAADPAGVLADIDSAGWRPVESREAILLREMELARIAAAQADKSDFAAQRPLQIQNSLILYYVAQKQDAKAEAILQQLTAEQRKDADLFTAQIELAARGHRLDAMLSGFRADSANDLPPTWMQLLRNAASTLAGEGDKTDALAIWEFVFERGQLDHDLMASDYMGVAEARLDAGDLDGAIAILRSMALLPGEGDTGDDQTASSMSNYDHAAALLEAKGHDAQAVEFLATLAKGVPWSGSYSLRLARAQLRAGKDTAQAIETLTSLAADNSQSYDLRVQAALAAQGKLGGTAKLGSDELQLLAAGNITPQQVQQPYFAAARIAAADSTPNAAERAALLREAIAINPAGLNGPSGFTGNDLRLKIFRAEAAAGNNATALDAIQPLLSAPNADSGEAGADADESGTADDESDSTNDSAQTDAQTADESAMRAESGGGGVQTLAQLISLAPLPLPTSSTDVERLALAALVAQVYESTGDPASALPYLKLAAYLQKDPTRQVVLQGRINRIQTALALESQNALRRPKIQHALNQSVVVRPQLNAAELTRLEAR